MNNIIQQEIQISEQHLTMMRSRNSRSQARIKPQLEHSQSQRMFYINDQLSRTKDISTIFHSPFKNGRKNTDYSNPTFLSSSIFYPQEEVKNQHSVRHNLVYNKNQKSKKQLYEKRIHRADDITVAVHQAAASDLHNRDRSRRCEPDNTSTLNRSRSFVRNDRNDQLTKELEALIKYREQEEKKNKTCRILTESLGENLPSETPVYIQKNRLEAEERAVQENKKNLKEWIQISEKIRSLKDTASQEGKKVENKALDSFVLNNVQRAYERDIENRKNAGMLATILREQIKQTQNKKNKQRKERYSFI